MTRYASLIWMFNHYTALAKQCWEVYSDIEQAAYMFDYYSERAEIYRDAILMYLDL